ncbi:metal ABC transporter solute-binding protein, Zn/Mn family [Natronolimnobius baerhuensis]|uniref:Metal ion ABC transporter substrate-binding protein n=1 Tax=Natronolimnobius baerhuensis TaxID=253108 RepID=A0A202ED79_9EURY|nr:zinc ABC transporter substrate-binding protein [Natronolimnobius baerhuensis]OVE86191.1 metal ion ABC transporter substrate-binding protein [Natronolimnobius baerhuensis]
MTRTRRNVLLGAGAVGVGFLAGCLGDRADGGGSGAETTDVYASFFTLAEFTRSVVGDAGTTENAVPTGQHGHEWEPTTDMLPNVVESDAFVYFDVEGFQPWVDTARERIEADHADDVALIDAAAGIELREYDDDHTHGHSHEHGHDDSLSIHVIALEDDHGHVVADAHGDHWHDVPLEVPVDETVEFTVHLETDDGEALSLADDDYTLESALEGDTNTLTVETSGERLEIDGQEDGNATVVLRVLEDGTSGWEAPPLEVQVGDGRDHAHADDGGHGHDHDHTHGDYDAKFFADPVLAQDGVRNIRDALIDLDPDNATRYEDNAASYIEDLEALHSRFQATLEDRDHDHVVLAGHDSFQYLAERYGFEIHTPVGLSPDDEPSGREIAAAVEFVEEHGLEYVLWDYFDGPDTAETIAAEAEGAVETVMVSPAESVVEEWVEDGHGGYIGQMDEINLPAFERALGAENGD